MLRSALSLKSRPFALILSVMAVSVLLLGSSGNPPNGNTGAPGEGLCSNCHGSPGGIDGNISVTGLPSEVQANTAYDLIVTLTRTAGTPIRGGFQLVALDGNNNNAGTFSNAGSNVAFQSSGGRTYSEHNPFLNFSGGDQVQFSFRWTSPAQLPGNLVRLYFSGLLANGNGGSSGDRVVNSLLTANLPVAGNDPEVEIINVVNVNCAGGNNGSATASVSNGIPPYVYNWSNGAQTATINNLQAGTYTITVTDANSATTSASVTIIEPPALQVDVTEEEIITCADPVATITVAASGGTFPYAYAWSSGQSTASIEVVVAGVYTVTVTDGNNCTTTLSVDVLEDTGLPSITAGPDRNISCAGGTVQLLGNGPAGPSYTIIWSTQNGNIVSGANTYTPVVNASGQYTLTVVNNDNGCISEDETTVNPIPAPVLVAFSVEPVSCFGGSNGRIQASVSGGVSPYAYVWSNGQNTPLASNLTAGTYSLTVSDANGCTISSTATVTQPSALALSVAVTPISGPGTNDGTATASVSGGTSPYTYFWSNGENTAEITGLAPGSYLVTVTDANGCFTTATAVVNPFDCNLTLSLETLVDASCFGASDGSISVIAAQGEGVVNYQWSNGMTGEEVAGLGAGVYSVTATDEEGCTASLSMEILQPEQIIIVFEVTPVSQEGADDGVIVASVSGGAGNYTYEWSNGETGSQIGSLSPGTYSLTATDQDGCTSVGQATIAPFGCTLTGVVVIVDSIDCYGETNGVLEAIPSQGTGPYSVLWNDGSTEAIRSAVSAGAYSVTITDANQCTLQIEGTLSQPDSLYVDIIEFTQTISQPGSGVIEVVPQGGTPPFAFFWEKEGQPVGSASRLEGLDEGLYFLNVRDANDCPFNIAFRIDLSTSTGQTTLSDLTLKAYPNPVSEWLTVQSTHALIASPWSVTDARGKVVSGGFWSQDQSSASVFVGNLPPGLYHWTMHYGGSSRNVRFIILR
jgi:hypothetical protein